MLLLDQTVGYPERDQYDAMHEREPMTSLKLIYYNKNDQNITSFQPTLPINCDMLLCMEMGSAGVVDDG